MVTEFWRRSVDIRLDFGWPFGWLSAGVRLVFGWVSVWISVGFSEPVKIQPKHRLPSGRFYLPLASRTRAEIHSEACCLISVRFQHKFGNAGICSTWISVRFQHIWPRPVRFRYDFSTISVRFQYVSGTISVRF